jgi:hypothetical protein
MAHQIKDTPILKGKDAKAFMGKMKANEGKKVSPETKKRIHDNFQKLNAIAKF